MGRDAWRSGARAYPIWKDELVSLVAPMTVICVPSEREKAIPPLTAWAPATAFVISFCPYPDRTILSDRVLKERIWSWPLALPLI